MQSGTIDCIIVTPQGFVFHRIPFEQLRDSRDMVVHSPKGCNIIFTIDTAERQLNAVDILMMYAVAPDRCDDNDGGYERR